MLTAVAVIDGKSRGRLHHPRACRRQARLRPVAAEVTDTNFRYWMMLRLQCSDEQMAQLDFDHLAEVWMAVVETDGGLRIGYWSQGAY